MTATSARIHGSRAGTSAATAGPHARPGRLRLPIIFSMLLATAALSAQAMPCLAYRHNDQVRIRCGTQDRLLISKRGLGGFAISGEHLAALTYTSPGGDIEISVGTASSQRSWGVSDGGYLYASCGTILAGLPSPDGSGSIWDVLTGRKVLLTVPRSKRRLDAPVCNSERTLLAGYAGNTIPGTSDLLSTGGLEIPPHSYPYGISPSGDYVAYSPKMDQSLCIRRMPGRRSVCTAGNFVARASVYSSFSLPVSDGGWVAFVGEAGGPCYYSGARNQNASAAVRTNQVDECWGIYAASPASPPKLLVVPADNPQWVSPAIAAKLLASASKQQRRP